MDVKQTFYHALNALILQCAHTARDMQARHGLATNKTPKMQVSVGTRCGPWRQARQARLCMNDCFALSCSACSVGNSGAGRKKRPGVSEGVRNAD